MKLYVKNLTGARMDPPFVGKISKSTEWQGLVDFNSGRDFSTYAHGGNAAAELFSLKAAGKILYQFVPEAHDLGAVGEMRLELSYANGDFDGIDATSHDFDLDIPFPVGALYLAPARLDVHAVAAGGAVSAATVASGIASSSGLFDASENVFAGVTRRYLTTATAGKDLSGAKLRLTLATTDGNISALTAGHFILSVTYQVSTSAPA